MIRFNCDCGKAFVVKPEHAGKKVRCPQCDLLVTIPSEQLLPDEPPPPEPPSQHFPPPELHPRPSAAIPSPSGGPWKIAAISACAALAALLVVFLSSGKGETGPDENTAAAMARKDQTLRQLEADLAAGKKEIAALTERAEKAENLPGVDAYLREIDSLERRLKESKYELSRERDKNGKLEAELRQLRNELVARAAQPKVEEPANPPPPPPPEAPKPNNASIADLVEQHGPAVVVVKTNVGSGAGFFITKQGMLATNFHVVSGSSSLTIHYVSVVGGTKTRSTARGTVFAGDPGNDLALVQALDVGEVQCAELAGMGEPLRVGDRVFAIGNPGVGNLILEFSVSDGILSSLSRRVGARQYLQTTAAINPGNSGGPLLNMSGKVIGVVTAKALQTENIGFAVPVSCLESLYANRMSTKYRVTGDFQRWEASRRVTGEVDTTAGIPAGGTITAMVVDEGDDMIYALNYEKNALSFISISQRKVMHSVFTGSEPIALDSEGRRNSYLWAANAGTKTLTRIAVKAKKVVQTIQLPFIPTQIAYGKNDIWCVTANGRLGVALVRGKRGLETTLRCTAVGYDGKRKRVLAGYGTMMLEIDPSSMVRYTDRLNDLDSDNPDDLRKQIEILADMIKSIRATEVPMNAQSTWRGRILVNERDGRIFFNMGVLDGSKLDKLLGVFKTFEEGTESRFGVRRSRSYLGLDINQIHAISPDGKWAASGTHIMDSTRFTAYKKLPAATSVMQFSKDSDILYIYDPGSRMIIPVSVEN